MGRRSSLFVVVVVAAIGVCGAAWGAGLGSTLKPFSLADQHGTFHKVDDGVRVIILTRDMAAGDIVNAALSNNGKSVLSKNNAVYMADVSGMPSFVRNLVALPKLKERPYPMLLDTDGDMSQQLPSREKHATLIFLDKLQITAVEYLTNPETLPTALASPKRFAAH